MIYRDVNGVITHTPIEPGGPTSSAANMIGIQSWAQVLGIVHSHTADTWIATNPTFKLFPTPNALMFNGQGDWWAYDVMAGYIEAAGGEADSFREFVFGPTGPSGTNQYELRAYEGDDRDIVTLGQKISLDLGTCDA